MLRSGNSVIHSLICLQNLIHHYKSCVCYFCNTFRLRSGLLFAAGLPEYFCSPGYSVCICLPVLNKLRSFHETRRRATGDPSDAIFLILIFNYANMATAPTSITQPPFRLDANAK